MAFDLAAANPYGAAAQAAGKAAEALFGGATSSTSSGSLKSAFDSSGWNINFGSGEITSERRQTEAPDSSLQGIAQFLPLIGLAVAGLIVWKIVKASKKSG